jgi:predicted AlkP superfamily phosphohydrolase/phosphomutase
MYQNIMYELIMLNLLSQRKNMNHEKHVIHEEVSTYANILPKYLSNMPKIINKITHIVYKE